MNSFVPALPPVAAPRAIKVPPHAETTLRNGLRVVAVRRPSVPRVEIRLRAPAGNAYDRGDGARARMLPETLLGGTDGKSSVDIATTLQRLGASLEAAADADDLILTGGTLSGTLDGYLGLVAEVVAGASFPRSEILVARDRLAQEILISLTQPQTVAAQAFRHRVFGRHPYGRKLPSPDAVRRIGPEPIRRFHADRVVPKRSTLIMIGDLSPEKALDHAERALSGWRGRAQGSVAAPAPPASGPILLIDRPGSVQTTIRAGGVGLPRRHPDYFKLALTNLVFGGYFASRLVRNIRESKGYTYSPSSMIDHRRGASTFVVAADVGTDVTAPALVEIQYELNRMAASAPGQEELDRARRYLTGVTSLSIQTQAGFASYLDALVTAGLGIDYLRTIRDSLAQVTADDVHEMGARYLAPQQLVTVLVGDARTIAGRVEPLGPLAVQS